MIANIRKTSASSRRFVFVFNVAIARLPPKQNALEASSRKSWLEYAFYVAHMCVTMGDPGG